MCSQIDALDPISSEQPARNNLCDLKLPPHAGKESSSKSSSSLDRSLPDQNPAASTGESPVRALNRVGLADALIPPSFNSVRQLTASYGNANSPERQDRDKRRKPGSPPSRFVGRQKRTRTDIPTVAGPEEGSGITMPPSNCNRVTNVVNSIDDPESNVLSPTSKAAMIMAPRKSVVVLEARAAKQELGWVVDGDGTQSTATAPMRRTSIKTTTRESARKLEVMLGSLSDRSTSEAASILLSMLTQSSDGMAAIRDELKSVLTRDEDFYIEKELADSLGAFFTHHAAKGTRPRVEQDAVEAVMVASTMKVKDGNVKSLAKRIGVRHGTLLDSRNASRGLIESNDKFSPTARATRPDCVRPEAYEAVSEFCHSVEGSNADSEASRSVKVRHPYMSEQDPVPHPYRVWHESTV
jgi:hypothetical protein